MRPYAAVMLSRQALRPSGLTPWVCRAVEAVKWLKASGLGLAGSVGLQTWELLVTLAVLEKVPLRLYLPLAPGESLADKRAWLAEQWSLDPLTTELIPVSSGSREASLSPASQVRDELLVRQADLLVPVSIRNSGHMAGLLAEADRAGQPVERQFETDYEGRREPIKSELDASDLSPELIAVENDYLVHWTRGTNTVWPGERRIDFYQSIVNSTAWPRSGFETLQRLVAMQRLIASARHMPGHTPTVSFSSLPPREVVPLMTWRARDRRMSFEPYGVGLARLALDDKVIQKVNYYDHRSGLKPEEGARWRSQSIGRITDWRAEQEYRCRGDYDFSALPDEAVCLFCRTTDEAEQLRQRFACRVIPFLA